MTFCAALLAASLSAGNAEFDRAAIEGAAKITMDRFAASVAEGGFADGMLSAAMLEDPSRHMMRGESEKVCEKLWLDEAAKAWAAEAESVRRRLGLEESYPLEMDSRAREALVSRFPEAFALQRKAAVEQQAKTIVTAIRPAERDLEEKKPEDLAKELTERILKEQKTSVFEENRATVTTGIVEPMLASGNAERKRQLEYAKRVRSDASAPSRIVSDISSKLEANVAERRKGASAKDAWGVFPSVVEKDIPAIADKRVRDRFSDAIGAVKLDAGRESVKSVLEKDPAAHAKAKESEKLFAAAYCAKAIAEASAKSVESAPADERAELSETLLMLAASEEAAKAAQRLVKRDVMPVWKETRAALADDFARNLWPSLMDGTWCPSAELADSTAARSDYDRAVRAWRKMEGMQALAGAADGKPVLEEAEKTADAKVAEAFAIARSAIAAQSAIVDEVHPAVLAESRSRKESFFRRTPDLAAIVEMLTEETGSRWNSRRIGILWPDREPPANASGQHAELFPSVKRKIELVARQILEEMQESRETPSESVDEESESLELSVTREGDGLTVEVKRNGALYSSETVPAKAEDFRNAFDRAARRIAADILKLR
ncbi:MAG: hypothetical protein K6F50_05045 [Kiritimatiellae bacterium]|nr:hypothetical protein [Kiritimatiellia bacterium]